MEKKTTKELARQLGILKRRSQKESKGLKDNSSQPFQYIVVIDFESTCWKDEKLLPQEIIEFPAVLLNTSNGQCESEFHFYVQPSERPCLSDFCKQLTGISQAQVEDGIPISLCLKKFGYWIDKLYREKNIMFNPVSHHPVRGTFLTWSDWDLSVCLQYECKRKQLLKPSYLNSWIDLRATYRSFYSRKPQGLNGALQDLGIEFAGRQHSGVDDARNTAKLAWRMIKDGCVLNVTKTLKVADNSPHVTTINTGRKPGLKSYRQGVLFKRPLSPSVRSPSHKSFKSHHPLTDCLSKTAGLKDNTNTRRSISDQTQRKHIEANNRGFPGAALDKENHKPVSFLRPKNVKQSDNITSTETDYNCLVFQNNSDSEIFPANVTHQSNCSERPNFSKISTSNVTAQSNFIKMSTSNVTANPNCSKMFTSSVTAQSNCSKMSTSNVTANSNCSKMSTSNVTANSNCSKMSTSNVTAKSNCSKMSTSNVTAKSNCSNMSTSNVTAQSNCSKMSTSSVTAKSNCSKMSTSNATALSNCSKMSESNVTANSNCSKMSTSNATALSNCSKMSESNVTAKSNCSKMSTSNVTANSNCSKISTSNGTALSNCNKMCISHVTAQPKFNKMSVNNMTEHSNGSKISVSNATAQLDCNEISAIAVTPRTNSTRVPSASCTVTPPVNNAQKNWCSFSVTPPLCLCGRRAKKRIVQSPGPNQGRCFFSCSNGKQPSFCYSKKEGCRFFKWETSLNNKTQFVPEPLRNAMSTGHQRRPVSRVYKRGGNEPQTCSKTNSLHKMYDKAINKQPQTSFKKGPFR